VFFHS
jgi:hypothetical protein